MIDYSKKGYKIALIALVFALVAISISGQPGTSGTNGTNGVSADTVIYYLHVGGVMNLTTNFTSPGNSITITPINGFNLIGNWTTPDLNMTAIPAGEHSLHYHAFKTAVGGSHVDNIVFECFLLYNNGTVKQDHGFSEQQSLTTDIENEGDLDLPMDLINVNSTDKWRISVYINQTGSGTNPSIRFDFDDQTDAAFRLPRLVEDNDTAYVNKSGDTMSGNLNFNGSDIISPTAIASNESMYMLSGDSVVTASLIFSSYLKGRIIIGSIYNNGSVGPYINISKEKISITNSNLSLTGNDIVDCANCQLTGHGLARAYLPSNQLNLVNNVATKITLNTTSYNPYGEFDTTTGNYTVSIDGYYDILAMVDFASGDIVAPGRYIGEVFKNDTVIMISGVQTSLNGIGVTAPLADTQKLNAGDNISLYAISQSGTNTVDVAGSEPSTWMTISLKSKIP